MKSKYGLQRQEKNLAVKEKREKDSGAPAYLQDEQKLSEELSQDYELANPEDAKAEARLAKLRQLEQSAEYQAKKK